MFSVTGHSCVHAMARHRQPVTHRHMPRPGCAPFDVRALVVAALATLVACGAPGTGAGVAGAGGPASGYLLVAQGNATLVDQIAHAMQYFRRLGVDVYLYDYRGYGLSEGKSRLRAIVEDYREIIASLNAQPYRRRLLSGMCVGGGVR